MNTRIYQLFTIVLLLVSFQNCSSDSAESEPIQEENEYPADPKDSIVVNGNAGSSFFYDQSKISDGLLLVNDAGNDRVYLMDYHSDIKHEWNLELKIGNDAELLSDGNLLVSHQTDNPVIAFGGTGGKIRLLNKNSEVLWDYELSNNQFNLHHDVEMLPNGNVLALVWERIPQQTANDNGVALSGTDLFSEMLIEIDIQTNVIVWQWRAWDHIIQDFDNTKLNFGNVNSNPQLIDINYVPEANGDIMHANGIVYDNLRDVVYISVNFYNEVWTIDHSTNTEEAKTNSGGNYNRGGDLIYRFGNANAYGSTSELKFDRNHFPNFTDPSNTNLLIFNNNISSQQSEVFELKIPFSTFGQEGKPEEPKIIWQFTNTNLFSPKVSGAIRLPNGNTLITEGDFGAWEVTNEREIVWKFKSNGFFWRTYYYPIASEAIQALNL